MFKYAGRTASQVQLLVGSSRYLVLGSSRHCAKSCKPGLIRSSIANVIIMVLLNLDGPADFS